MPTHGDRFRILVFLGLALAVRLSGQTPPLAPEFVANEETFAFQGSPAVSSNGEGGFLIVWSGPDYANVLAQRFDAGGNPLGNDFQVNTDSSSQKGNPATASDATGRFVVAWTGAYSGGDGSAAGVFGRVFDSMGLPLGPDFLINTYTTGRQVIGGVAMSPAGNFVVVWKSQDQDGTRVYGQRFDSSATPQGSEFHVATDTLFLTAYPRVAMGDAGFVIVWPESQGSQIGLVGRRYDDNGDPVGDEFPVSSEIASKPEVTSDASGNFVVVWAVDTANPASANDIRARRFDSSGNPLENEFTVNSYTSGDQFHSSVAMGPEGEFVVAWTDYGQDASGDIFAQRFDSSGQRDGSEFAINTYTTDRQIRPAVARDSRGQFVMAWESWSQDGSGYGVVARRGGFPPPRPMAVDSHPGSGASNLNGILEAGETAVIEPAYSNTGVSSLALTGTISNLTASETTTGAIVDGNADYGTIDAAGVANCHDATGDCYELMVSGSRRALHWDATFDETITSGVTKIWSLHVGESFPDVPTSHSFYAFIENLFHNGVTGGCAGGNYCPTSDVTRAQMAVFLLKSKFGAAHVPPLCTGAVYVDVPCAGGPFDPWIEELAALQITGGCGGSFYCPGNGVTRQQMAVFLLKTLEGASYYPPDCTGIFDDVPCTPGTGFSDWIEELSNGSITGGCSVSPPNYCPTNPNTRGQMAVFLTKTFGLLLYGP